MSQVDATVVVVGAGYPGKRHVYETMTRLGARLVFVEEPGHWSSILVEQGLATAWVAAPLTGDNDVDAAAAVAALAEAGIKADGVLTFWEYTVPVAARVATLLGLPANPPEAVDAARSKVRTRELSAELGLPTPRAARVSSLDGFFRAADKVGVPAVLKPEFGAGSAFTLRIDELDEIAPSYALVRSTAHVEQADIFRCSTDLILEEYLDGEEFDIDLVLADGQPAFVSTSQNWPTPPGSLLETGLHCPPTHDKKAVAKLVDLAITSSLQFGFRVGVLHVEGKTTSRGPRLLEINSRMGGGRIAEVVRQVWGVDLVEAQLRASLGLPLELTPSRKPKAAVANAFIYAPRSGTLVDVPAERVRPRGLDMLEVEVDVAPGDQVAGPEDPFQAPIGEITLAAGKMSRAREAMDELLREPPVVTPAT